MKKLFTILLFLLQLLVFSQADMHINNVEAFFMSDSSATVNIYPFKDSKQHEIVTIKKTEPYDYVLVLIKKSEGGWFQIKNISYAPLAVDSTISKFNGAWLYDPKLYINLVGSDSVPLYTKPVKNATCINVPQQKVQVLKTRQGWAMVKCTINGKTQQGWVYRKNQCAFPWTICNWN
ncbi:MAG TPA: hypothetical protein VKG26_14130 [Bacteroidia bacterium]|nr:hypothetical protein [Bacteroidia bacterium]